MRKTLLFFLLASGAAAQVSTAPKDFHRSIHIIGRHDDPTKVHGWQTETTITAPWTLRGFFGEDWSRISVDIPADYLQTPNVMAYDLDAKDGVGQVYSLGNDGKKVFVRARSGHRIKFVFSGIRLRISGPCISRPEDVSKCGCPAGFDKKITPNEENDKLFNVWCIPSLT